MRWWNVYVLAALFVLSDAQRSGRRRFDSMDAWARRETPSDNLIDIDLESDRNTGDQNWPEGSGNGVDSTDDEDFVASGSGSGDGTRDRTDVDRSPTANAGPDITIMLPQNRVTLCGNSSHDDHLIVSYQWLKKTHLLSADMMGTSSVCMQVSNLQIGDYTFTLVVTDSGGNKASADVNVYVKPDTPLDPATPCERLYKMSQTLPGVYVPRCTEDGYYESVQCRGHPSTGRCWCSDLDGREIPGTAASAPHPPDCDEGSNLPSCVFMLVRQSRTHQLGAFRPVCTMDGFFQPEQCSGSECYCVHRESGVKIPNTQVNLPNRPVCDGSAVTATRNIHKTTTPTPETTTVTQVPVISTTVPVKPVNGGDRETETKPSGGSKGGYDRPPSAAGNIMTQPGILAAIIGGSVVVLLCAVLLVMFVVYRMRKKDEGSYALDEPKKMPNYSYQRAPDKEFYA